MAQEARKFAKANKAMAQNIMLRKKFGLDNDEALVEKFRCSNAKMNGGWLYITSSFICFDTLLQQGDSRLAVKIEDVREVKKYKFAQVVDNGIKFAMKTGKVTQKRYTHDTHDKHDTPVSKYSHRTCVEVPFLRVSKAEPSAQLHPEPGQAARLHSRPERAR